MRIPYAMRTLMDEIESVLPDAVVETRDPDGFGVWRTLVLDLRTTEALRPLLEEMTDQRIAGKTEADGQIALTFVADPRADDPAAFSLDTAYRIISHADEDPDKVVEESEAVNRVLDRRAELQAMKVADLRETYDYPKSAKKADIITAILSAESNLS